MQQSVEPAEPAEPAKEPEEAATSAQEPAWSADPTPDLSRESREFEESSQAEPAEPSASPYVEAAQAEAAAAEPQLSGAESANVPEASEVPVEAGGQEQLGEEGIGADSSPEAVTEGDGLAQHPGPQLGKNKYPARLTLRSLFLPVLYTYFQRSNSLCAS